MEKGIAYKIFLVSFILLNISQISNSAPSELQTRSLAENYTDLNEDIKWFFRGISKISETLEKMLPKVDHDIEARILPEDTKFSFLMGLRHFLMDIRELSISFEQGFNTDKIMQIRQLKYVTNFANDILNTMKMWFNQIRILVVHIVFLYNRYIPEVLFGKCVSNYLARNFPERSYYEYPYILLLEIYSSIVTTTTSKTNTEISTEANILDNDLNMTQNEISLADNYDKENSPLAVNTSNTESFFDLSSVLGENKDGIIESAASQHSWQICFKMYTADTISRSLKTYFLGL